MKKILALILATTVVTGAYADTVQQPSKPTTHKIKKKPTESEKQEYLNLELKTSQLGAHYDLVQVKDPKVWYFFVKLFPSTPITKIYQTPYKNVYAVVAGKTMFYGQIGSPFVMVGHLFNPYTQQDQTSDLEQLQVQETKVDLATVDISEAVITKGKNNPKGKKMIVIEDPDCPYCRVLEQQIVQNGLIDQIDIYRILIPLPMHPNAKQHIINVYCAKDGNSMAVLDNYMIKGDDNQVVKLKDGCDATDALMKNGATSRGLNVNGTPTMVLGNGKLVVGADIASINDYINKPKDEAVAQVTNLTNESNPAQQLKNAQLLKQLQNQNESK